MKVKISSQELLESDPIVKEFLKIALESQLPIHSIYLFGSRALGNAKENSDYDFLVLLDTDKGIREFKEAKFQLIREVHEKIQGQDFDILIRTLSVFEDYKNEINTLYNQIYEDGLILYENKRS